MEENHSSLLLQMKIQNPNTMKTYITVALLALLTFSGCQKSDTQTAGTEKPHSTYTFSEPLRFSKGFFPHSVKINDTNKNLSAVLGIPICVMDSLAPFVKITQDTSEALLHRFVSLIPDKENAKKNVQNILEIFPVSTVMTTNLISTCYKAYAILSSQDTIRHYQTLNYLLSEKRLLKANEFFKADKHNELLLKLNASLPENVATFKNVDEIDVNIEFDSLCFNISMGDDMLHSSSLRIKFPFSEMAAFCVYDLSTIPPYK